MSAHIENTLSRPAPPPGTADNIPILCMPIYLLHNRRDPHSREAHPLDIIQLLDQAAPGTAAVVLVRSITRRRGRQVGTGEAVRHDLVDGLAPPLSSRETGNRVGDGQHGCRRCEAETPSESHCVFGPVTGRGAGQDGERRRNRKDGRKNRQITVSRTCLLSVCLRWHQTEGGDMGDRDHHQPPSVRGGGSYSNNTTLHYTTLPPGSGRGDNYSVRAQTWLPSHSTSRRSL